MHIQLFISKHAPEGPRLRETIRGEMQEVPILQCLSIDSIGRTGPSTLRSTVVAVIMVSKKEELLALAACEILWDRIKTILVLPDSEEETVTLGHALRPRYISFAGSDFTDIVAVLNHIRKRVEGDIYN